MRPNRRGLCKMLGTMGGGKSPGGKAMPLRKQKGNMYSFVTHTWNPIKGRCPHECGYCYMRKWGEQPPIHLDEKELQTDLGQGNFIFVGSSCDMWADGVPMDWIIKVMRQCEQFPGNTYLFQSKNPWRLRSDFSLKAIFGTTIETNRRYPCMGKTPRPMLRAKGISRLSMDGLRTMVTIEPILDFDLYALPFPSELIHMIKIASPEWVNIGADSGGHNLPEPSGDKVRELIEALEEFTTVKIKKNLNRIRHV